MARILITGSTEGLGLSAARSLIADGHDVVLHARTPDRAASTIPWALTAGRLVTGDLSSAAQVHDLSDQVNRIGRMDAVIHNAGIFLEPTRAATPDGHARTLAVNTLAPYLITALIQRPARLVFLSSSMHRDSTPVMNDIDWTDRVWDARTAYCESKLYVAALALALAARWTETLSNAVDPGWVPTRMGGTRAPDDLVEGHVTQAWLAAASDPASQVSGGYWHHRSQQQPAAETTQHTFHDALVDRLGELTGVRLD